MQAEVTRDVVSDLWPLYMAGEATPDSRRLVEAYLAQDESFRTALNESERIRSGLPDVALTPDAELRLIAVARERTRTTAWLVGSAIAAAVFIAMLFVGGALLFALREYWAG